MTDASPTMDDTAPTLATKDEASSAAASSDERGVRSRRARIVERCRSFGGPIDGEQRLVGACAGVGDELCRDRAAVGGFIGACRRINLPTMPAARRPMGARRRRQ